MEHISNPGNTADVAEQGKVFAIKGDRADTSMMLISLAEKLSEHKVLFIDCAHCFNQPFVKKHGRKNDITLKNIFVARPFTPAQFRSIINKLKSSVPKHNAKSIIISGFDRFLTDSTIAPADQLFFTESIMEELMRETKRQNTITIIGVSSSSPIEEEILEHVQLCMGI